MKYLFCVVCAMMVLALGSLSSAAEVMTKPADGHRACAPDIAKFCKDAKGPHDTIACLKTHEAELSPACKNHAQHGPGRGAMIPSSHAGVVTAPQPAPPVGTGATATPAAK